MKRLLLIVCACLVVFSSGCANHIRYADNVIWDRVKDTDKASLDDQRVEGAVVRAKVRFICKKQQFAVTNDYITPYHGQDEFYEVPVGLVTWPFSMVWWIGCNLVSLGGVEASGAALPLHWSTAGLNPCLNVENGMFAERYAISEKAGSRRAQEGSTPEPYDAVVAPMGGEVKVHFDGGATVPVRVGEELLLTVNLIEAVREMPGSNVQKVQIEVTIQWNPKAEPVVKTLDVFIDKALANKLYALKAASLTLMTTMDQAAFDKALAEVEKAGFSREAAMVKDKRKGELVQTPPQT